MSFLHWDLGHLSRGDVVRVTLSKGANVRLLDSTNFRNYKNGARHRYHGGLARRSPVDLPVPRSGRWHTVVDMQGLRGSTRASVSVIPSSAFKPLPPISPTRQAISAIASSLEEADPWPSAGPDFDCFICHASEDKDELVRPLAEALRQAGLSVWYDEFEMRVGDSLRRKIDAGIARSRFGLVVVSRPFFSKSWSQYELDGLVTMAVSGRQVLLPLWHGVTKDDVLQFSPTLADRVALQTADYSIQEIADELASVILEEAAQ